MGELFTHKAEISIGGNVFKFDGSREYAEQQVAKILEIFSQSLTAVAGPNPSSDS